MARLIGPDDRTVYLTSGPNRGKAMAQGLSAVVYADAGATTPADILTEAGAPVSGSTLTIDAYSQIPLFQFPDGADTVFVKVGGGPVEAAYARTGDRLGSGYAPLVHASRHVPGGPDPLTSYLANDPAVLAGDAGGNGLGLYPPPRLAFPSLKDTVITTFQPGHGWTTSGIGATFIEDTSDYCLGSQSYRITTAGGGASHEIRSPTLTAMDLSSACLILAVKVDDFTNYSDLQVRISSNGFTDFAYCKPAFTSSTQRWVEPGQWHLITVAKADVVSGVGWNSGGMQYSGVKANVNWSAITGVRLRVVDNAAGTVTARFNLVGYFPAPPKPLLSIIFDDGRATQYTVAKPYMDRYRIPGTATVIIDSLNSGSVAYMTPAQVKELRDKSKWSVCAHANENVAGTQAHQLGYDGITYADGEADMLRIKNWLHRNGFAGVNGICYPHGTWSAGGVNTDVLGLARKYFDWGRTTYNNTLETFPPAHPMKLRAYTVANGDTLQNLTDVLDQGIAGKAWTIMQFHNIVTPALQSTETTPAIFQGFIDAVASRVAAGTLSVRTVQELIQYGAV